MGITGGSPPATTSAASARLMKMPRSLRRSGLNWMSSPSARKAGASLLSLDPNWVEPTGQSRFSRASTKGRKASDNTVPVPAQVAADPFIKAAKAEDSPDTVIVLRGRAGVSMEITGN